jgi:hypothetical protein
MSEYEVLRRTNIKRNQDYLKSLGLIDDLKRGEEVKKRKRLSSSTTRTTTRTRTRTREKRLINHSIEKPLKSIQKPSSSSLINTLDVDSLLAMAHPFAISKTDAMYRLVGHSNFTFSRLSGIQTFANAIVLFVNLDQSNYDNVCFDDSRRLIQWFAQSRQSMESPAVARIVGGKTNVFLLVRNGEQGYTFCGRVEVDSVGDTTARPLAFRLRLLDRSMPR